MLLRFVHLIIIIGNTGFGADMAGAEAAFEHLLHRAGELYLSRPALLLSTCQHAGGADWLACTGKQITACINDGDVLGAQPRHRGRDEVENGTHPLLIEPCRPLHRQLHRRLRLLTVPREGLAMWQHQMHPHRPHALNGPDRARQFALHRTGLVHRLLKGVGRDVVAPVEDFVADRTATRQTFARQNQPGLGNHIIRHQHLGPACTKLMRDFLTIQHIGDLPSFPQVEIGIEQRHMRRAALHGQQCQQSQRCHRNRRQSRQSANTQGLQAREQILHCNSHIEAVLPREGDYGESLSSRLTPYHHSAFFAGRQGRRQLITCCTLPMLSETLPICTAKLPLLAVTPVTVPMALNATGAVAPPAPMLLTVTV